MHHNLRAFNSQNLLICCVFLYSFSFGFNEDAVVNGTAQFLLDRAQQNYMFIFEKQLKENELFKQYFRNTSSMLENMSLQLILTNGKLLRETIIKDMENSGSTSMRFYKRQFVATFGDSIVKIRDTIIKYDSTFKASQMDVISRLNKNIASVGRANNLNDLFPLVDESLDTLWNHYKFIPQLNKKDSIPNPYVIFLSNAEVHKVMFATMNDRFKTIIDTSVSFTTRISTSLQVIKMVLWTNNPKLFQANKEYNDYKKHFDRFTTICFFFSQVADANNPDQIKNILKAATIPAVSFGKKRAENENKFTINSYLGVNTGSEYNKNDNWNYFYGLAVPIGVEFAHGMSNLSSWGFMLSIFDLGSAINAQLYKQRTPRIADVFVPGLSVLYGIPELPVSAGLQVSYGTGLKTDANTQVHFSFFLAFDMPLIIIEPLN